MTNDEIRTLRNLLEQRIAELQPRCLRPIDGSRQPFHPMRLVPCLTCETCNARREWTELGRRLVSGLELNVSAEV